MKKILSLFVFSLAVSAALSQGVFVGGSLHIESEAMLQVNGNFDIQGGSLIIDPGSILSIGDNKTLHVTMGGSVYLLGTESQPAIITSPGYFNFIMESGSTIGAQNAVFERMANSGLYIQEGANIDAAHPLSDCIFQYGGPGSTLMTIENDQIITINGATFKHIPGNEVNNVMKTPDAGKVTFTNYQGEFAGEEFENDVHSRIHWIAWMPVSRLLENITLGSGQDTCFDALKTIVVAGNGNTFEVEEGGNADLIARENIIILYGTLIESGGQFHALITTDDLYCTNFKSIVSVNAGVEMTDPTIGKAIAGDESFHLFPNPTAGLFHLEFYNTDASAGAVIEIYNLLGKNLHQKISKGARRMTFDLSNEPSGIYLVRGMTGSKIGVQKIIKK